MHKIKMTAEYVDHTDGLRVMFLIHRNKEGGSTNNTKLEKLISRSSDEWYANLERLLPRLEESVAPLRVYASVNPRDPEKGIREFKRLQLEADYYDDASRYAFYDDIRNRYISALMRPASRAATSFLIDLDTEGEYEVAHMELDKAKVAIKNEYRTKSGWHLITEPYNPAETPLTAPKINKDGLMLVAYV